MKANDVEKAKKGLLKGLNNIASLGEGLIQSILASTVAKWRWALKGSLALMTGENSTPWHLTIGNPYSPFVSLGNVVVDNVELVFNNEFAFNDMPTLLKVKVTVRLGRSLGSQEIFQMFNNGYNRTYEIPTSNDNTRNDAVGKK